MMRCMQHLPGCSLRVCSDHHAVCGMQSLSLKARENLSSQTSATITIPTAGDQPNVEIQLTRNTLDKLAADLLRKLRLPMEQVRRRRALSSHRVRTSAALQQHHLNARRWGGVPASGCCLCSARSSAGWIWQRRATWPAARARRDAVGLR
jgi:hypothetical protein